MNTTTQNNSNAVHMIIHTHTPLVSNQDNKLVKTDKMDVILNTFKSMNDEITVSGKQSTLVMVTPAVTPQEAVAQIKNGVETMNSIMGYNKVHMHDERETTIILESDNKKLLHKAKSNLNDSQINSSPVSKDDVSKKFIIRVFANNADPIVSARKVVMGMQPKVKEEALVLA
jgi:DNA-binding transcriptional regulator WhiA